MTSTTIVTTALPYANGPLHLGHMVEHIQADIWVRNQRMQGNTCLFLSGDDAHGTPIMLRANEQGITPEALIASVQSAHQQDAKDFLIDYDYYGSTHSTNNQQLVYDIYNKLREQGLITTRPIEQAYDEQAGMFLPDRFVKGTCPSCGAADQYGDNCDVCGATYSPIDLIDPYSTVSNTTPTRKTSTHYFFTLSAIQSTLETWIHQADIQPAVRNKLQEWLQSTLRDWDISRDGPYFGFPIPDAENAFFYVWVDAPIGYFSILQSYLESQGSDDFARFITPNSEDKLIHFIGKDITYFHGLFWPAMLHAANYKRPDAIYAHGFLTVNGAKMSKSKGTFITARTYLESLPPEYLRYYLATRLSDGVDDLDLHWEEFTQKINADLIGKVINIASRTSGFITKKFDGKLADQLHNRAIVDAALAKKSDIIQLYNERRYSQATATIMQLADTANQYIAQQAPWQLSKDPDQAILVQQVCTTSLNLFKILITYLAPILPETAAKSRDFLQVNDTSWEGADQLLLGHTIAPYRHLLTRVESQHIPTE